jgi:hypothetical protein
MIFLICEVGTVTSHSKMNVIFHWVKQQYFFHLEIVGIILISIVIVYLIGKPKAF